MLRGAPLLTDKTNARPWFKAHVNLILDDDRLGDLPCEYYKIFVQLYALCARHGEQAFIAKNTRQLAKRLSFSTELMESALHALEVAGLVAIHPDGVEVVAWSVEQPEMSDAERKRRERTKKVVAIR